MYMLLALIAVLYIPETSPRTIAEYPLAKGQIAYKAETNGTASVFIGSDNEKPLRLVNPLGLEGYRETIVPRADLTITFDDGISYNGATDTWWWDANITNVYYKMFIVAPTGTKIRDFAYTECGAGNSGIPGSGGRSTAIITNDNQVVIEGFRYGGTYGVSNLVVTAEAEGNPEHITDLTDIHVQVKDYIGISELAGWRYQLLHAYDGNRGEDWADYSAKRAVKMNERPFSFGSNGLHRIGMNLSTNLAVMVRGNSAMEFRLDPSSQGVAITNITHSKSGSSTTDTFSYDSQVYQNSTDFQIQYAVGDGLLADVWAWVDPSQITFNEGTFSITWPDSPASRFYRVYYHNNVVDAVEVIVRAPLSVEGGLSINGTNIVDMMGGLMSTNNAAFCDAVRNVPIVGADADDVSELSEYGSFGTVGAILLALVAAVAALKRNKADVSAIRYEIVSPVPDANGRAVLVDRGINKFVGTSQYSPWEWGDGGNYGEPSWAADEWSVPAALSAAYVASSATGPLDIDFYAAPGLSTATTVSYSGSASDDVTLTIKSVTDNGDSSYTIVAEAASGWECSITYAQSESYWVAAIAGDDVWNVYAPTLSSIPSSGTLYCNITGSTTVTATRSLRTLGTFVPPSPQSGKARDLIVRVDLTSVATEPSIGWSLTDASSNAVAYESEDGGFPVLEAGKVNLLALTETDSGTFAVAHKTVESISS